MKRRALAQLRRSFLPLAGLIACLAGRAESAAGVLGAYLIVRLSALDPDDAYLYASADELSTHALARYRKTAALQLLIGSLLAALALNLLVRPRMWMSDMTLFCWWLSGTAAAGCQIFFSILSADRERDSAALGEALLSALLAAAMLLGDPGWRFGAVSAQALQWTAIRWNAPELCAAAALLALMISWLICARIAPPAVRGLQRPAGKLVARAPLAVWRGMFCPLLLSVLTVLSGPELLPAALAGWALYAGSAALYRRSSAESPAYVAVFVPIAALVIALALLPRLAPALPLPGAWRALDEAKLGVFPCASLLAALAAVWSLLLNAHPAPLPLIAAALLALEGALPGLPAFAGLPAILAAAISGALAVCCAIPSMREAAVSLRAARLRRKRQAQRAKRNSQGRL